jgi:hypothetical protein
VTEHELIEKLSDAEHRSWSRWMKYLFAAGTRQYDGSIHLPLYLVHRWQRQIETPYAGLSEQEKQSDRNEVAHILPIIKEYVNDTKIHTTDSTPTSDTD